MEYCGGGNALELVNDASFTITQAHVATILQRVLTALAYLEEHEILHRVRANMHKK
jgi:serine/threonine protein kinase